MRSILFATALGLLVLPVEAQEMETHIYKRPLVICPDFTFSEEEFIRSTAGINPVLLSADGLPLAKILTELNRTRVEAGLFSFEADHILVGVWSKGGKINVSFALFQNGCLLPGTSQTKTIYEWLKIAEAAGVTCDDFRAEGEDA